MLAASSPFPGRLGCSRYRVGIRDFWQARTSEAGGLTLTSRHAHKSRIRTPSVGSSGPTFRNPRAIDGARARKFAESLELRTTETRLTYVRGGVTIVGCKIPFMRTCRATNLPPRSRQRRG